MRTTIFTLLIFASISLQAQLLQKMSLPAPSKEAGIDLMQAMKERKSSRNFNPEKQTDKQQLSNLLWAAYGYNREGKRTVPSAMNEQPFKIYVFIKGGVFLWDAEQNILTQVAAGDQRAKTGMQDYVADASVNLVYVADISKMEKIKTEEEKYYYAYTEAGCITQNVYLYAASQDMASCVRASIDKAGLAVLLKLTSTQKIILAQSIGFE